MKSIFLEGISKPDQPYWVPGNERGEGPEFQKSGPPLRHGPGTLYVVLKCFLAYSWRKHRVLPSRLASTIVCVVAMYQLSEAQQVKVPPKDIRMSEADVATMVRRMKVHIRQSDKTLKTLKTRMPKLRNEIRQLIEDVRNIPPPKEPEEKPPEPAPPEKVKFRPPREKLVEKSALNFICQEGRVSFIDFDAINQRMKNMPANKKSFQFELPDSDFLVRGTASGSNVQLTVVRKPQCLGETWQKIQERSSRFQRKIASADRAKVYIVFNVWPDSYDVYRKARALSWKMGYGVGWTPMVAGSDLKLTRGISGPGLEM